MFFMFFIIVIVIKYLLFIKLFWFVFTESGCRKNEFTCSVSGRCIPQSFVCDEVPDCGPEDNSDEENCELSFSGV